MMKLFFTIPLMLLSQYGICQIYATNDGLVHFVSDAPLEIIEANSDQMQGLVDIKKKIFAFKLYVKSFDGFNNPLQQIHFYENYLEAEAYPIATFKGKILEPIKKGKAKYRAKGILEIHGKPVERIIEVAITLNDNNLDYTSQFEVLLEDHDIELPQIVYQKISKAIQISVTGKMQIRS